MCGMMFVMYGSIVLANQGSIEVSLYEVSRLLFLFGIGMSMRLNNNIYIILIFVLNVNKQFLHMWYASGVHVWIVICETRCAKGVSGVVIRPC